MILGVRPLRPLVGVVVLEVIHRRRPEIVGLLELGVVGSAVVDPGIVAAKIETDIHRLLERVERGEAEQIPA